MQESVPKAAPEPQRASNKDRHGGSHAAAAAPAASTHAATAAEATATLQVQSVCMLLSECTSISSRS